MFAFPSSLKRQQLIPISIDEAWDFFSKPKNLKEITPPHMAFKVHTPEDQLEFMYPGQLISYTVKPIAGFPIKWTTEITHVEKGKFFVDEQRFGPYKLWHHQHHFETVDEGVLMTDLIHYLLPFGPLGWIGRKMFVSRQLEDIFDYRVEAVEKLFGKLI